MYCKKCGSEIDDEAVICVKCGCYTDSQPIKRQSANSSTKVATAKFFAIFGAVIGVFMLFIPTIVGCFAVSKLNNAKTKEELTGTAVCTLLFCSTIAGIIMLCITDEDLK